jgi:hypothetical protein
MARGITSQDYRTRKAELEPTLRLWTAQANIRILVLESRCAVIGTAGSNPTLSANLLNELLESSALCKPLANGWSQCEKETVRRSSDKR